MAVSAARRIAFEVLRRVEEGAYASDLLHARLAGTGRAGPRTKAEDAALATELTLGVLRWQRLLDFFLTPLANRPVAELDAEVRLALRLGLYQLRFLTRVPARAAVHESVELVKRAGKTSAAALVNAVLRRAATDARAPVEPRPPLDLPAAEKLGIVHSHPTWLVERWLARYGPPRTQALLEANNRPPRLTAMVHDQPRHGETCAALKRAGFQVEPAGWLRQALLLGGGNPAGSRAYRQGWMSIQDEASQMVPLLLDVQPEHSVLDLCAAPGGKTAALARAAGPEALVVAADRHTHRLAAMCAQLQRLGVRKVSLLAADALASLPFSGRFDRILVDAPCSGTGTLARNPEIRWRLCPGDLADFHQRQGAMLRNALDHLAPGGRLVYATCSLEPEENEQVVAEVLRKDSNARVVSAAETLAAHLCEGVKVQEFFGPDDFFRTFPPDHRTDGFFAAVLETQGRVNPAPLFGAA